MNKKIFFADIKGSYLPLTPFEGSVQSIYSKAVNLSYPSGILISIVISIDQMSDYGLVVPNFNLLISELSNGSKFKCKQSQIIFSSFIIDFSRASLWSGLLNFNTLNPIPNSKDIKNTFFKYAMVEGFSPLITKKDGNIYSRAAKGIIQKAYKTLNISDGLLLNLGLLVGLGIGFTPSGDDFLSGVMLWEKMSGITLINRKSIESNLLKTTDGGRTLLTLVLSNSFPYYLKQFAELIANSSYFSQDIVKQVLKHGSTSGCDSLTGFLWAIEKNVKNRKKTPELN